MGVRGYNCYTSRVKVAYLRSGKGPVLLLLHGWGLCKEKYQPLVELLARKYEVVVVDLPGFGQAEAPKIAFRVEDYAQWVVEFIKQEKIRPELILGHSLGGRIAIKLAANRLVDCKRMILVASAGIERKSLRVKIWGWLARITPEVIKNRLSVGSKDYREARGVMKDTMKLVVGENLENDLPRVSVPTLLVWGREDRTTPLWQAKIINQGIAGSKLVVMEGNHGLPYKEADKVAQVITKWTR